MILTVIGYLFRAGSVVKRGEDQKALVRVSEELLRLDRPPAPR